MPVEPIGQENSSAAFHTLKSRVCYVTQTVVFSVAVISLVIWQAWLFLHLDVENTNMNEIPGDCKYNGLFIGEEKHALKKYD